MNVILTVVPEKEAEFKGEYEVLIQYLSKNSRKEISALNPNLPQPAFIQFTVNEYGNISDIDLKKSSGYPQIDKAMFEIINNMPEWNPAENAKGEKVSQNFELALASSVDGC